MALGNYGLYGLGQAAQQEPSHWQRLYDQSASQMAQQAQRNELEMRRMMGRWAGDVPAPPKRPKIKPVYTSIHEELQANVDEWLPKL